MGHPFSDGRGRRDKDRSRSPLRDDNQKGEGKTKAETKAKTKQMRGFFALLRMTSKRKATGQAREEATASATAGPSISLRMTRFSVDVLVVRRGLLGEDR
jgi:hypothetical protein